MVVLALSLAGLAVVLSLSALLRPSPVSTLRRDLDAYRLEVSELIDRVERLNRRQAKREQREGPTLPAALPFNGSPLTRAQRRYAQLRERAAARAAMGGGETPETGE